MDGNVAHPFPPPTNLRKGHKVAHDAHEGTKDKGTQSDADNEIGNHGRDEHHDALGHHETHKEIGHKNKEARGGCSESNEPINDGRTHESQQKDSRQLKEQMRDEIRSYTVRAIRSFTNKLSALFKIGRQHGDAHENHEGHRVEETSVNVGDDLGRVAKAKPHSANEN